MQLAANVDFTFETGRKSVRPFRIVYCIAAYLFLFLWTQSLLRFMLCFQVLEMLHSCAKEFADDVLQVEKKKKNVYF